MVESATYRVDLVVLTFRKSDGICDIHKLRRKGWRIVLQGLHDRKCEAIEEAKGHSHQGLVYQLNSECGYLGGRLLARDWYFRYVDWYSLGRVASDR